MLSYMVALFLIPYSFFVQMVQENKSIERFDKDEFLKALGLHLKHKREEIGISASELSKRMFLERSHIARIETGRTNPTSTTLRAIASALGISLDELFKGFNSKI